MRLTGGLDLLDADPNLYSNALQQRFGAQPPTRANAVDPPSFGTNFSPKSFNLSKDQLLAFQRVLCCLSQAENTSLYCPWLPMLVACAVTVMTEAQAYATAAAVLLRDTDVLLRQRQDAWLMVCTFDELCQRLLPDARRELFESLGVEQGQTVALHRHPLRGAIVDWVCNCLPATSLLQFVDNWLLKGRKIFYRYGLALLSRWHRARVRQKENADEDQTRQPWPRDVAKQCLDAAQLRQEAFAFYLSSRDVDKSQQAAHVQAWNALTASGFFLGINEYWGDADGQEKQGGGGGDGEADVRGGSTDRGRGARSGDDDQQQATEALLGMESSSAWTRRTTLSFELSQQEQEQHRQLTESSGGEQQAITSPASAIAARSAAKNILVDKADVKRHGGGQKMVPICEGDADVLTKEFVGGNRAPYWVMQAAAQFRNRAKLGVHNADENSAAHILDADSNMADKFPGKLVAGENVDPGAPTSGYVRSGSAQTLSAGMEGVLQGAMRGIMRENYSDFLRQQAARGTGAWDADFRRLECPRDRVLMRETLGKGHFGSVSRALLLPRHMSRDQALAAMPGRLPPLEEGPEVVLNQLSYPVPVAIKSLFEGTQNDVQAAFMVEARMMATLQHPRLLRLLAVCTLSKPFLLISEYMRNGDLKQYLQRCRNRASRPEVVTNNSVALVAQQVSEGMMFLADRRIVHRDLAARNILVAESGLVSCGQAHGVGWAEKLKRSCRVDQQGCSEAKRRHLYIGAHLF